MFGGSFDPFHNAHLHIIKSVLNYDFIDQIVLIPNKIPPHKEKSSIDEVHRFAMVKQVIEHFFVDDRVVLDDIELRRPSVSWTIDTVREFQKNYSNDIYLIIGSDSFFQFHTWKDYKLLLDQVKLIVFGRGDVQLDDVHEYLQASLEVEDRDRVIFESFERFEWISSTEVRRNIQTKKDILAYLPEVILKYIEKNNLYR